MRAMAVTEYGAPLERIEVSEPQLRPGHALIEVLTCGVCFSDIKTARGQMPFSKELELPHPPGHEICGQVVDADPPGALEPGTKVVVYHVWPCRVCSRCRAGENNICVNPQAWVGFTHPGGFQDRLLVPLDRVVAVPDSIDPVRAAPMTCALGTAYRATVTKGGVTAGSHAVVIGLGGVGIHALQVARAAGALAVGLDTSQEAIDTARGLGLDARRADEPDTPKQLVHESGGEGVDVVIDTVGQEETIQQADRLVRPGGRIIAVGYSPTTNLSLPSQRFVLEEIQLLGSRYVRLAELERAIRLVADGRVEIVVDSVKPLEAVNEAFDALETGDVVGRVVLDIGGVS
jgi:D-arabinose 1-dehydrogenase-like Zn-dependent alcohol dehydrogenase